MENTLPNAVREPSLINQPQPALSAASAQWSGRGQNFLVSWNYAGASGVSIEADSADEIMLMVLNAAISIAGGSKAADAPARSICILPPGKWQLQLEPQATCVVLTSLREGAKTNAVNESAYEPRDARIAPVGEPYKVLKDGSDIRVFSIDSVSASKDKPRLKMLQTATMSINWVEYQGPRNREALSPHSHKSFEQGSLALAGDFMHHLRVEWGENANLWQEDKHAVLNSPSLLVVPVQLIHTTEGVGEGHHLLIDVFSPPRADFIAKGWVFNSGDYAA